MGLCDSLLSIRWDVRLAFLLIPLTTFATAQHPEWGPPPPVAPYTTNQLPTEKRVLPLVFPVIAKCRWNNGYNVNRGAFRHTGIDIRAPKMSPVVAPFSGLLGMKRESFWIYGDNGWAMLGTHLNDDNPGRHDHAASMDLMFAPNLVPGQHVQAGQFIGYLGESGDATAPHLHFELYVPGDPPETPRIRNPFPSLKVAQTITRPVPFLKYPEDQPASDELRFEGCVRKVDREHGWLTVIAVAKQYPSGKAEVETHPRYLRFQITAEVVQKVGGWDALEALPRTEAIALYVPASTKVNDSTARRVVIHPAK